jgi:hypothetical protein
LWNSGKGASPPLSAFGVNGVPIKTQERQSVGACTDPSALKVARTGSAETKAAPIPIEAANRPAVILAKFMVVSPDKGLDAAIIAKPHSDTSYTFTRFWLSRPILLVVSGVK